MGEDMREVQEAKEEINEKYRGLKEDATDAKLVEFADYLEKKYEDIKEATKSKVSVEMKKFLESGLAKIYMKILKASMAVVKRGREQEKTAATVQAMVTFQKLFFMEQVLILTNILILVSVPLTNLLSRRRTRKPPTPSSRTSSSLALSTWPRS